MRRDLNEAFARFRDDEDAWVAIVTGAGRAFCAGADLRDGAGSVGDFAGTFWEKPTINSFESGWEIFKPVIAAVNGYCLGYGLTLVTWCDFVIASERADVRLPRGADRRPDDRRRDPAAAADQLAVRDGAAAHRRPHRRGARKEIGLAGGCPPRAPDGRGPHLADRLVQGAPRGTCDQGGGDAVAAPLEARGHPLRRDTALRSTTRRADPRPAAALLDRHLELLARAGMRDHRRATISSGTCRGDTRVANRVA